MQPKFELGRVVATAGVNAAMQMNANFHVFARTALAEHAACNWGDLCEEDAQLNDAALKEDGRILSAYKLPLPVDGESKLWIITEADRSVTTLLWPSEY